MQLRLLLYVHSQRINYEFLKHEFSAGYGDDVRYSDAVGEFARQAHAVEAWLSELLVHYGDCVEWSRVVSRLGRVFRQLHLPPVPGIPIPVRAHSAKQLG